MPNALTFHAADTVSPPLSEGPGNGRLHTLLGTTTRHCGADAGLILARHGDTWRVMAVSGTTAERFNPGDRFATAQNPSLSPDYSPARQGLSTDPDPFHRTLGPLALNDWIAFPVVAGTRVIGMLHLFSGWDAPFTEEQLGTAVFAADVTAGLLPETLSERTPASPTPNGTTSPEMGVAISLLNHDLRSPVNAILGFAELLATRPNDSDTVIRYAEIINKGGHQLTQTLDQVVTLMRALAGQLAWERREIPLSEALLGLDLEGQPEGLVNWDGERMRLALSALAAYTEAAGGGGRVTALGGPTHVHLTIGSPEGEEQNVDPACRAISVQLARQVALAHGGILKGSDTLSWFNLLLPRNPDAADTPPDADLRLD